MIGWHSHSFQVARDPGVDHLTEIATRDPGAASPDGVVTPFVIGTQLHGPALALNPELADLVLAQALGVSGWDPLPIPSVQTARARRIAELTSQPPRATSRRRLRTTTSTQLCSTCELSPLRYCARRGSEWRQECGHRTSASRSGLGSPGSTMRSPTSPACRWGTRP